MLVMVLESSNSAKLPSTQVAGRAFRTQLTVDVSHMLLFAPVQIYGGLSMTTLIWLPSVVRWPPAPAKKPRVVAGAVPLVHFSNGKVSPIKMNRPLLTLIVTVPAATRLFGA